MSQMKSTILVIVGVILLLLAYNYTARGNKIDILNQTVGGQQVAINGLNKAAAIDKKSDAITDKVVANNAVEQQSIEKRFDRVAEDTQKVETVIRQKYDKVREQERAKAPSGKIAPDLEAALADQQANDISAARLAVLRDYLCDIDPTVAANCVKGSSP